MKKNSQYLAVRVQETEDTSNSVAQASEPISEGVWLEFDDSYIQLLSGRKPRITYYQSATIYQPIK